MDYKIELESGIFLEFELEEYCPGEAPSRDCPGEGEMFAFDWKISIEDITFTDDIEAVSNDLAKINEGRDIQELMEEEYKKQNQPEPDAPY